MYICIDICISHYRTAFKNLLYDFLAPKKLFELLISIIAKINTMETYLFQQDNSSRTSILFLRDFQ